LDFLNRHVLIISGEFAGDRIIHVTGQPRD
jgi:hypothetical protein